VNDIPCKEIVVDNIIWAKYHHTFIFFDDVGSRHNIIKILFIGDHMAPPLYGNNIITSWPTGSSFYFSNKLYTFQEYPMKKPGLPHKKAT
jgi:hypothetical protein